jgi:diguanylate cyclase
MASAQRHHTALAVLFVDVDRFKHINDTLGHGIGDHLLKSIAQRLVACLRSSDTVSRYGGDEFVVLLPEVAHSEDAALSARKILAALSTPHRIEQQELHVTVSVGIGVYPEDGTDAEALLKNADTALLNAKAQGRSKHQSHSNLISEDRLRRSHGSVGARAHVVSAPPPDVRRGRTHGSSRPKRKDEAK